MFIYIVLSTKPDTGSAKYCEDSTDQGTFKCVSDYLKRKSRWCVTNYLCPANKPWCCSGKF